MKLCVIQKTLKEMKTILWKIIILVFSFSEHCVILGLFKLILKYETTLKRYFFKQASDDKDYGILYLYFAPRIMLSEELTLYTPLCLFAEIGGYVGLLLGVSVWNFAAWISDILELKIQKLQRAGEEEQNGVHRFSAKLN